MYQRKIERLEKSYGDKWRKFLEDHTDLISQTTEAVNQEQLYRKLSDLYRTLRFNPKTRDLADRVHEEINFKGIGIDTRNKLNPLLEQVWQAMARAGLKPEDPSLHLIG